MVTFALDMPRNFTVKMADDEAELIRQIAADRGATPAEILRDAIRLYLKGEATNMKGADAGFIGGRALASQLTYELLREAWEHAPKTHDDALLYLAKRKSTRLAKSKS